MDAWLAWYNFMDGLWFLELLAMNSSMASGRKRLRLAFTSREGVEIHILDVCELKASGYLRHFTAWNGELLFDLVTASVDMISDVFGNVCAC